MKESDFVNRYLFAMENPDCIGCGYCCWKSRCELGRRGHPEQPTGVCPSLVWDGKRHWCKVYLDATGDMKTYVDKGYLYLGTGCCSNLNSWRFEPLQDRRNFKYGNAESDTD